MAGKFGVSRQRITQIINDDEILKKQATSQINITSVNEFLEGVKQDDIANNLGITQGRVSQILKDFKKDHRLINYLVVLHRPILLRIICVNI